MRLDALTRDPQLAYLLTAEQVVAALAEVHVEQARLAAAEGVLVTRLLALQAQPAPTEDELLDMPTVGRLLGIPESKAREMGRRGHLPVIAVGKYIRVSRRAVEAFMAGKGIDRQGIITLPSVNDASQRG